MINTNSIEIHFQEYSARNNEVIQSIKKKQHSSLLLKLSPQKKRILGRKRRSRSRAAIFTSPIKRSRSFVDKTDLSDEEISGTLDSLILESEEKYNESAIMKENVSISTVSRNILDCTIAKLNRVGDMNKTFYDNSNIIYDYDKEEEIDNSLLICSIIDETKRGEITLRTLENEVDKSYIQNFKKPISREDSVCSDGDSDSSVDSIKESDFDKTVNIPNDLLNEDKNISTELDTTLNLSNVSLDNLKLGESLENLMDDMNLEDARDISLNSFKDSLEVKEKLTHSVFFEMKEEEIANETIGKDEDTIDDSSVREDKTNELPYFNQRNPLSKKAKTNKNYKKCCLIM